MRRLELRSLTSPLLVAVSGVIALAACTSDQDLGSRPDGGDLAEAGADASDSGSSDSAAPGDAGSDAGSDGEVDSGEWTPKQLPGLQLWLDTRVGIVPNPSDPGRVRRWLDQSGNGHHATAVQSNDPEPTLDPAALNGLNVVRCDTQASMTIDDAPGFKFGTGDFGVVAVAKVNVSSNGGPGIYSKDNVRLYLDSSKTLRLSTAGGEASVSGIPVDKFQVLSARGTQLEVRGGGNIGNGPKSTADLDSNAPVSICTSSSSQPIALAEMLVVKGTLSDADLAKTESYLKAKFGL